MNTDIPSDLWSRTERELREAEEKLGAAQTATEFQGVGLVSREALGSLARQVYDPARHATTMIKVRDGKELVVQIGDADAIAKLGAYFDRALQGSDSTRARKFAHAALDLANEATHDRSADLASASLALSATQAVVKLVTLLERRVAQGVRRVSTAMRDGLERDVLNVYNWIVAARERLQQRQAAIGRPGRPTMFIGRLLDDLPGLDYWPKDARHELIKDLHYLVRKIHATVPMPAEVVGSYINELASMEQRFIRHARSFAGEYGFSLPLGLPDETHSS